MRSLGATLIIPLLAAAASPANHRAVDPPCDHPRASAADGANGTARFRRLGDLPPANETLAVLRSEDGCTRPVIVRYGIGSHLRSSRPQVTWRSHVPDPATDI